MRGSAPHFLAVNAAPPLCASPLWQGANRGKGQRGGGGGGAKERKTPGITKMFGAADGNCPSNGVRCASNSNAVAMGRGQRPARRMMLPTGLSTARPAVPLTNTGN